MSTLVTLLKKDMLHPLLAAILALFVYIATLAPGVLFADGGEFQFVPWLPGIAHPTGYPLYTLLGWLFSHLLPLNEVAWRLNLFSAVTGAIAVAIVYTIIYQFSILVDADTPSPTHHLIAYCGALTFAFSHTFWSQAIIAEVYSLHALFVAAVLGACLQVLNVSNQSKDEPNTKKNEAKQANPSQNQVLAFPLKKGLLLAFVFGLSLTHHRTMVLMLPAILLAVWLSKQTKISLGNGLKLLIVMILPNLLYLYLPLIAPTVPYVELNLSQNQTLSLYDNSIGGFIKHIMGNVFAADVQPAAIGWDRLILSLTFMRQQFGWMGGLLGLIGLISLRKSFPILALTLGSFITFLAFNLIYFIGDVYVLFIPCWLILSIWIALGCFNLAQSISRGIMKSKSAVVIYNPVFNEGARRMETRMGTLLIISLTGLSLILPMGLLFSRYAEVNQRENIQASNAWDSILRQDLPENSILLSNDRNEIMPMWYYQWVENRRPDWLGLFPLITPEPDFANVGRVLEQSLASGRPVYLIKPMPGLEIKADLRPLPASSHAQLIEASTPTLTPSNPLNLDYDNRLSIIGYDLRQSDRALEVTLYWQVGDTTLDKDYTTYVHLIDANNMGFTQSDHRPGGVFYPSSLWHPGEILRDTHTLALPANIFPGDYILVAGLYFQAEAGGLINLGERQVIGEVTIE